MSTVNIKDVYVISDREIEGKAHWTKIGVAFVNKDGSLNVIMDSLPLTGKIHIRDRKVVELKDAA